MKGKTKWVDFQKVKEQVSIGMILEQYRILDEFKRKEDKLTGKCPLHEGSNSSQFSVSLSKNVFHCFSSNCRAKGNVLDFVAYMEKVSIREAALMIQEWFDLDTGNETRPDKTESAPGDDPAESPEPKENEPLTFRLKDLDTEHPCLKDRGLNPETIDHFGIGYCFRGIMAQRIAIPVHNERGDLVAYAGRTLGDVSSDNPKYKLPPNFKKALVVFNLHRVRNGHLVLVEGYFDVFNLWQAGITNSVALMGSAMSEEQERLILGRVGQEGRLSLMFDGDEAGQTCAQDAVERLVQKVHVKVIKLKEGQQPNRLPKEAIQALLG